MPAPSSLVFVKDGEGFRAFAMKSGLKLDALTFDALLSYECTNDTAKLEVLLKDMTIDALKNTLTELNLGVRNKNPNKAVLVRSIVSQWENVKRMAHENHVVATLTDAMATSSIAPAQTASAPPTTMSSPYAGVAPFQGKPHSLVETESDDDVERDASDVESISDFIELPKDYLDDPSDFDTLHLLTVDTPPVELRWLVVKELKGRTLCIFSNVPINTDINTLKVMIVKEFEKKADAVMTKSKKKPLVAENFLLRCDGAKMDGDDEVSLYMENEAQRKLEVELELTLKGGGKKMVRKDLVLKNGILAEKKKILVEHVQSIKLERLVIEQNVINETGRMMTELFNNAEVNPIASFKYLLKKLTPANLGTPDESPALDLLKLSHSDLRVSSLCNMMMRDAFGDLYALADEVNGMIEGAELTYDFILNQAFLKENGQIGWQFLRRALEDEQTRRDDGDVDL